MPGGSFTVLPNGSLQISKASVSDFGTYICVAQNPAGTALGKTKLRVQGRVHAQVVVSLHQRDNQEFCTGIQHLTI